MTELDAECRCCRARGVRTFHRAEGLPVNSVLLLRSREEAQSLPRGDMALAFCERCGFVQNSAFDRRMTEYSHRYEETQGFSQTFRRWHRALAENLIRRHDLRGKRVVEIGCGKGEFLSLLCELGDNEGIGFDPAFVPERIEAPSAGRMMVVRDFYSERYGGHEGDFVCCKMTLEHIPDVLEFVSMVRRSLRDAEEATVFFQVPDLERILEEDAFWDVYYEHCSYFSAGALADLFQRAGFRVLGVDRQYAGQYLTVEAKATGGPPEPSAVADDLPHVARLVARFERQVPERIREWRARLDAWRESGKRVVLWGAGSKAVAFLGALGGRPEIRHAVDVNPHKSGFFLAGSGQEIVGPERLDREPPDVVVVMNPIYRDEIAAELGGRGLRPELVVA